MIRIWSLLVKSTGLALLSQGIQIAGSLWLTRLLVRNYGNEYGGYVAGIALLALPSVFGIGLSQYVTREFAGLREGTDTARNVKQVLGTTAIAATLYALTFLLFSLLSAEWVATSLIKDSANPQQLALALKWFGVYYAVSTVLSLPLSVLNGLQELVWAGWVGICQTVCYYAVLLVIVRCAAPIYYVPAASIISAGVAGAVAIACLPREIRRAVLSWPIPDRTLARDLIRYGAPFIPANIFGFVKGSIDQPIIAHFMGGQAVLQYYVTSRLVQLAGIASSLWSQQLFPLVSRLLADRDHGILRSFSVTVVRLSVVFGALGAISIWLLNEDFVTLWMGRELYAGVWTNALLCLSLALDPVSKATTAMAIAGGRLGELNPWLVLEAATRLVLSMSTIQYLGLAGVALATVVSVTIGGTWKAMQIVLQLAELTVADLAARLSPQLRRLCFVGLGVAVLAVLVRHVPVPLRLIACTGCLGVAVGLCCWTDLRSIARYGAGRS